MPSTNLEEQSHSLFVDVRNVTKLFVLSLPDQLAYLFSFYDVPNQTFFTLMQPMHIYLKRA